MTRYIDRISKETLDGWKTELSRRRPTEAFRSRIDEISAPGRIPRQVYFRQPGLAFLRDAWIASRVAQALSSNQVRLVPAERPDFEIQTGDRILQFEATEAGMDGRRRGDEPDDIDWRPDPVESGLVREAMVRGLSQEGLKQALYGDFPLPIDEGVHSIH